MKPLKEYIDALTNKLKSGTVELLTVLGLMDKKHRNTLRNQEIELARLHDIAHVRVRKHWTRKTRIRGTYQHKCARMEHRYMHVANKIRTTKDYLSELTAQAEKAFKEANASDAG